MNTRADSLLELYMDWLKRGSSEEEVDNGWVALTFPFLDRHNDHIQVFVSREADGFRITDDGETVRDLRQTGCDLAAHTRRREIAEEILRSKGLDPDLLKKGPLTDKARNGDFPDKLHSILLAMLAIDSLANVSPANVVAIFKEDVGDLLRRGNVPFEEGPEFKGASNTIHRFDFLIPPQTGDNRPKVIQTLPNPDKTHVNSFAYEVIDTRKAIHGDSPEFYAVLNDTGPKAAKKEYLALLAEQIIPLRWTRRNQMIAQLTRNR